MNSPVLPAYLIFLGTLLKTIQHDMDMDHKKTVI